LIENARFGTVAHQLVKIEGNMPKLLAAAAVSLTVMFASSAAYSGPYPFGDEPYRLDFGSEPQIDAGCWKWNWQQYQWNNYCPVYVQPKAYMYPRPQGAVLRTKG
jgi:hypothetical protein